MQVLDKNLVNLSKPENITIQQRSKNGNIIHRYVRGKFLGKGGFAKCYELTSLENDKKYAVKVIEKASLTRSKAKQKLASQIKIHQSLRSTYIVGFNHYFEDEENVYIILELCSNQTLNQLIKRRKRITQIQAKYYIYQIAMGIKDIHNSQVIHRDLKLGNLFLTERLDVKIGDFGLAAKLNFDAEKRKTMCGTPNYIAPEILQNHAGHSYEVDIWSLGVIAYAFVVGRPPFQTSDVKTTYSRIKSCNYSFPENITLSQTIKRFISKMLMKEPSRRATIEQILNDTFFTQMPFPKALPMSLVACPPNAAFIKQYSEQPTMRSFMQNGTSTSRQRLQRKQSQQCLHTDRRLQKEKDSFGRVLVRASSNDRMEQHRHQPFQRASSTNALMLNKKQIFTRQPILRSTHGQGPPVWITYFEQNPKFGVCYFLNSNATGMRFNDSTFLISNNNFTYVKYYANLRQNPSGQTFQIGRTPEHLNKKMKIITHYYKELKDKKQQQQAALTNDQRITRQKLRFKQNKETAMNNFIVKNYKTSKVNIFWFNNKDYQVIFKDLTEILVSKDKYIVYVNKMGERKQFLLSQLAQQTQDIKKRMNHATLLIQSIKQTRQSRQTRISQAESNKQNNPQPIARSSSSLAKQSNKQNNPQSMLRSSSMVKIQKMQQQPLLHRSNSTTNRLPIYKIK